MKCSHSNTKWNRDGKAPLRHLDFKGFFEKLDRNSNDNAFTFVLEKLDKDELKHQFDYHNIIFNCHIREGELGKILTPSVDELSIFVKTNLKATILALKIDWLVVFAIATNGKMPKQVTH